MEMVDNVGYQMFAIYQIATSIVLVNMLIAMMSHSFEAIQVHTALVIPTHHQCPPTTC